MTTMVTVPVPEVMTAASLVPLMVTVVPTPPEVGVIDVTVGAAGMLNAAAVVVAEASALVKTARYCFPASVLATTKL